MRRRLPLVFLAVSLVWVVGCLSDLESTCQSDTDCPAGQRCSSGEIRSCIAGPGSGGKGGVGGTGGDGGVGGVGGDGGTGGFPPVTVPVELQFELDTDLAVFLERPVERPVHELAVRYNHIEGQKYFKFPIEPQALPGAPLEFTVDASYDEVTIEVEAMSVLQDGTPAVFAKGSAVLPEAAIKPHKGQGGEGGSINILPFPLDVTWSIAPDFNFDGDKDPDAIDCAPDDDTIFHGSSDVCNGDVTSCGPALCTLELPDGQHARDVACSPATGRCVVAVGAIDGGPPASGSGSVRIYPTVFDADSQPIVVDVSDPLGVAVNDAALEQAPFLYSTPSSVRYLARDGTSLKQTILTSGDTNGVLVIAPHSSLALAFRDRPFSDVFDPTETISAIEKLLGGRNAQCGSDKSICNTIDLTQLGDSEPLGPQAVPRSAVISQATSINDPVAQVIFSGDSRMSVMRINPGTREISQSASGTLVPLSTLEPRGLGLSQSGNVLFVGGGESGEEVEAAWIRVGISFGAYSDPTPFPLPAGACPAALDGAASAETLLMADDCTGSLWLIPLEEEGHPSETADVDAVRITLPEDCRSPSVLASIPAMGEEQAVTFIGCKGSNQIVVLGRN